jgi:plastocyanin
MLSLRLAIVSGVLIVATACGGSYSSSTPASPTPTPAPGGTSSSVAIPIGAASLGTAAFMPDQLNVAVGETVTWTNTDSVAHTSTSDAAGWDSGIVAPGGHFSSTFQTAGTFSYHCAIHPGMVGTVVVH